MKKNETNIEVSNNIGISKILRECPLKDRLYISTDMDIRVFLIDIGFIPRGFWDNKKEKIYGNLIRSFARKLTKRNLDIVKEWEKDGRPVRKRIVKNKIKDKKLDGC
jgi:hypothetical protein